jgi:hypothetical protein
MTIDERMEFLMQSIESHDRQIGELAERIDKMAGKIDNLAETTQLNFDRLTTAMMGLTEHVADHPRRIEKLEQ